MMRAKRFFIYGLLGWGLEIVWTSLDTLLHGDIRLVGFTNLWMFFIYGIAVFLEPVHDVIGRWNVAIRAVIWVCIIWGIEYASGMLLYAVLGVHPWYYSGPFSVNGLIRLDFAPAWGVAGLLFERVHKFLDRIYFIY